MFRPLLLLAVLVAAVVAQTFNFVGQTGNTVTLTPITNTLDSTGTVTDFVIGCDFKDHTISPISADGNSFGSNSGNYLSVTLDNSINVGAGPGLQATLYVQATGGQPVPITVETGTRDPAVTPAWGNTDLTAGAGVFRCVQGSVCNADYYCASKVSVDGSSTTDFVPAANLRYFVRVQQLPTATRIAYNNYTLTVKQWREAITVVTRDVAFQEPTIAARTYLASATTPALSVPGPRTWRHYFVSLNPTVAERALGVQFRVRVETFQSAVGTNVTSGQVQLCVNANHMVGNKESPITSTTNTCEVTKCADSVNLDATTNAIELVVDACSVANALWIGVRTPLNGGTQIAARYVVKVSVADTNIVRPVSPVTYPKWRGYGWLSTLDAASCTAATGQFACENYYQLPVSNAQLSAFDNRTGPYLVAVLHGVEAGTVSLGLAPHAITGTISNCAAFTAVCSAIGVGNDCLVVIPPCQWKALGLDPATAVGGVDSWVFTVYTASVNMGRTQVFYALDVDVVQMPVTAVPLATNAAPAPYFDDLYEGYFHHYTVTFAATDLKESSQFAVEFYVREEDNEATLYWNFGALAGSAASCYANEGSCRSFGPRTSPTGDASVTSDFCRFEFVRCDDPWLTNAATPRNYDNVRQFNTVSGKKVAALKAGTYYFSVEANTGSLNAARDNNYQRSLTYTLTFQRQDELQLAPLETLVQHVWPLEFSRHYFFDMPTSDPTIDGVTVIVADLQNHQQTAASQGVVVYLQCNRIAGPCPCWSSSASDTLFRSTVADHVNDLGNPETRLTMSRCSCPGGRVWATVEGRAFTGIANGTLQQEYPTRPFGYTITAVIERTTGTDSVVRSVLLGDSTFIAANRRLSVGRYPQWSRLSSTISNIQPSTGVTVGSTGVQCASCLNYNFYLLDFSKTAGASNNDALLVRVQYVPLVDDDPTTELYLYVSSGLTVVSNTQSQCGQGSSSLSGAIQSCRTHANQNLEFLSLNAGSATLGNSRLPYDRVEQYSYCQVVFEPCTADDATATSCIDSRLNDVSTSNTLRKFDLSKKWFAAVQNTAQRPNTYSITGASPVAFSLYASLKDQSVAAAVALTSGVSIKDTTEENTYKHYRFTAGSAAANSFATFEFYSNYDQLGTITFFLNRATQAGLVRDCYSDINRQLGYCAPCETSYLKKASCWYTIRPCEFASASGDFFVSAYQNVGVVTSPMDTLSVDQLGEHAFFDSRFEFTIRATVQQPTELLSGVGYPLTGHIHAQDSAASTTASRSQRTTMYYQVTVPSTVTPSTPAYLRLRVWGVTETTQLYITISEVGPALSCNCRFTGYRLGTAATAVLDWSRDYCDLRVSSPRVYYVTIEAEPTNFWNPSTFTIHSYLQPITLSTVTLVSNSTTTVPTLEPALVSRYDSQNQISPVPSPAAPIVLKAKEYRSYAIAFTPAEGRTLNVRVMQDNNEITTQAVGQLDAWLTFNTPVGAVPSNDANNNDVLSRLISVPGAATCPARLAGSDTSSVTIGSTTFFRRQWQVTPCAATTAGTYYLSLGGDPITANRVAKTIQIAASVVDLTPLLVVPSGTSAAPVDGVTNSAAFRALFSGSTDLTNDIFYNRGLRYLRTTASISINAGDTLTFRLDNTVGSAQMWVNPGAIAGGSGAAGSACGFSCAVTASTAAPQCQFVACAAVTATWYVTIQATSATLAPTSFTISRTYFTNPSTLSTSAITASLPGQTLTPQASLPAGQWRYHTATFTPTANIESSYTITLEGSTAVRLYQVATPVNRPNLVDVSSLVNYLAINANGVPLNAANTQPNCGATLVTFPLATFTGRCCSQSNTITFAVYNPEGGSAETYTIRFEVVPFATESSTVLTNNAVVTSPAVGVAAVPAQGITARRTLVWHKYTLSTNAIGFWYQLTTTDTTNTLELHINVGARAGSVAFGGALTCAADVTNDLGACYANRDATLRQAACSAVSNTADCQGFIQRCLLGACAAAPTVYFGIQQTAGQTPAVVPYSLRVIEDTNPSVATLTATGFSSVAGTLPSVLTIADRDLSSSSFANYKHFAFRYNIDYSDLAVWFPDHSTLLPSSDPRALRVLVSLNDVRRTLSPTNGGSGTATGPLTATQLSNELETFVSTAGLAGSSASTCLNSDTNLCTNSQDIDSGSASVGARRQCTIPIQTVLESCGTTFYYSVVRRVANLDQYSFSLLASVVANSTITNDFNIVTATPTTATAAGTVLTSTVPTFTTVNANRLSGLTTFNQYTYIRLDTSSFVPGDYLVARFRFVRSVLESAGLATPGSPPAQLSAISIQPYLDRDEAATFDRLKVDGTTDTTFQTCDAIRDNDGNALYDCSIVFDPAEFGTLWGGSSTRRLWFKVNIGSTPASTYSFGYRFERLTSTALDTVTLAPTTAAPTATATLRKIIYDQQWQWFDVVLPTNTGYYSALSVALNSVDCVGTQALEVYVSFGGDVDVIRPARWSSTTANVNGATANTIPNTFTIADSCRINAGTYRIGVFAPFGSQLFPNPITTGTGASNLLLEPVSYTLTASVTLLPVRSLDVECSVVQTTGAAYVPRYETRIDAENRGTQLSFTLTLSASGTAANNRLYVSRNANPYASGTCAWDGTRVASAGVPLTAKALDYYCELPVGQTTCVVVVPVSEFDSGRYFAYTDLPSVAAGTRVTVSATYDRKYTPVADLTIPTTTSSITWTGLLVPNFWQYYKVNVASSDPFGLFTATLTTTPCDSGLCSLDLWVGRGVRGYTSDDTPRAAAATYSIGGCRNQNADANGKYLIESSECHPHDWVQVAPADSVPLSVTGITTTGSIVDPFCNAVRGTYFVGVRQGATGQQCTYKLTVSSRLSAPVQDVKLNAEVCASTSCSAYYRLDLSTASQPLLNRYSSVTITLTDLTPTSRLVLAAAIDRFPTVQTFGAATQNCGLAVASQLTDATSGLAAVTLNCLYGTTLYFVVQNSAATGPATCNTCSTDIPYRVVVTGVTPAAVPTIPATGSFTNSGLAVFTSASAANSATLVSGAYDSVFTRESTGCGTNLCSTFGDFLVAGNGATYFVQNARAVTLSSVTFTALTAASQSVSFFGTADAKYRFFSYTPASTVESFSLAVSNVDVGCNAGAASLVSVRWSTTPAGVLPCNFCTGATALVGSQCSTPLSFSCLGAANTYYFAVFTCATATCPVRFSLSIVETSPTAATARARLGGVHSDAFTTVTVPYADHGCAVASAVTTNAFYIDTTSDSIISVALREPFGGNPAAQSTATGLSVTATLRSPSSANSATCDGNTRTCSIFQTQQGSRSSCWVSPSVTGYAYSLHSCAAQAGRHYVDVSFTDASTAASRNYDYRYRYSIQGVNAYVGLATATADTSLVGSHRHFYKISTLGKALSVQLTVINGPAVEFSVHDGCQYDYTASEAVRGAAQFQHTQVCAFGLCRSDIPSAALHSGADSFYIVLTGKGIPAGTTTNLQRNINADHEKPTLYRIAGLVGTGACGARPTSGFCSAANTEFGVSAFDDSSATWSYTDLASKDREAQCRYQSIVSSRCPSPTAECKRLLRIWSCLESFPACDANGFLQGTCRSVCEAVECACGRWFVDQFRSEFQCRSSRYLPGATGTCHSVPVPTPPPNSVVIVTPVPTDTQVIWIALLDAATIITTNDPTVTSSATATACTTAELSQLINDQLGRSFNSSLQLEVLQLEHNKVSIRITGSNLESSTSIAVRLANAVNGNPSSLYGTCLQGAVVEIQEPEYLLGLQPDSVVNPPADGPNGNGPPGPPGPAGPPGPPGPPGNGGTPGTTTTTTTSGNTPTPPSVSAASSLSSSMIAMLMAALIAALLMMM